MSCSKEEIERKRLAAIQKRQSKVTASPLKNVQQHLCDGPSKSFNRKCMPSYHPYSKPELNHNNENSSLVNKVVSGTVYLISEERFEVNPSEFCTPLINVFKSLTSRQYDSKSKLWNFLIDDYQELMNRVSSLAPYVVLGPLPNYVLSVLRDPTVDPNSIDLTPIESSLRNKLMPFQEEGVRFGIAKRGRCMIADDMGLGKTFQALAIASYYKHNWPLLIVTTSSMRETWQSKIHELLPSIPMMNIVSLSSNRDAQLVADRQTEIVIASYKIISTKDNMQLLKNKKFGVVIIDESHYLKSHKAQCTLSVSQITRFASRTVLLSGTPALSRPVELFTQLSIIQPKFFNSYTEYGKRYCAGKLSNFGWDMSGQSNLTELQILLQKKFLIRRTKEQVLDTLQDKTRESVLLDRTLLEFSKEDQIGLSQKAETFKSSRSNERHAALLSFYSETSRVKIPAICKYISQLLKSEQCKKFLVFAHHRSVIDAVCLTLDELGVHYICIVGSTPANTRADLVDKFQLSPSCRCAVLSITAANSGITLTAANLVLFAELHWNPGILVQAESRAHRIGQRSSVSVRYLLASGTADDHMWALLQEKLNVLNEVGLSKDSFEDTTTRHQTSQNNISQYLVSPSTSRNKNDYISGTNIRKSSLNTSFNRSLNERTNNTTIDNSFNSNDDNDKSFIDDQEGDDLLANLDL